MDKNELMDYLNELEEEYGSIIYEDEKYYLTEEPSKDLYYRYDPRDLYFSEENITTSEEDELIKHCCKANAIDENENEYVIYWDIDENEEPVDFDNPLEIISQSEEELDDFNLKEYYEYDDFEE